MKIINKISVKSVGIELPKVVSESMNLIEIIGFTSNVETGLSTFGEWTKLLGRFEATNLQTGEVFISGSCFLPSVASSLIVPQLSPDGTKEIRFAFIIGIKSSDSAIGYEYTVEPLIEADLKDKFIEVRAAIEQSKEQSKNKQKQLKE